MRRHSRTQRLPREHFEAEERPALLPAPTAPYDVPTLVRPKVGHRSVRRGREEPLLASASSLRRHSSRVPRRQPARPLLRARAAREDAPAQRARQAVHRPRRLPRGVARVRPARRRLLRRQGARARRARRPVRRARSPPGRCRGPACAQLFKLLGLARKYGDRLDASCKTALDADMVDVYRLADLVRLDTRLAPPPPRTSSRSPATSGPRASTPSRSHGASGGTKETNREPDVISPELKTVLRRLKLSPHARHAARAARPRAPAEDAAPGLPAARALRRGAAARRPGGDAPRPAAPASSPTASSSAGTRPPRSSSTARSSTSSPRCASSRRTTTSRSSAASASARPSSPTRSATSPAGAATRCSRSAPTDAQDPQARAAHPDPREGAARAARASTCSSSTTSASTRWTRRRAATPTRSSSSATAPAR